MEIKVTTNYELFKKLDGNRDVTCAERMMRSIETLDLTAYNPILVDDREMRIIDGQHRFEACKKMGKPIYYLTLPSEIAQKAMVVLNQYQKQWRQEEFLRFHAVNSGGCYKELYDFYNKYHELGISNCIAIYPDKWINATAVRYGKVEFSKYKYADDIVSLLLSEDIRKLPNRICHSRPFVVAIRHAFEIYDKKQISKLVANALKIPHCADYEQYLTVFKNIIKPKRKVS